MSGRAQRNLAVVTRRRLVALASAVGFGVGLLPVVGLASTTTVTQTSHFIQVATAANITGSATAINNIAAFYSPTILLFVSPMEASGGVCPCIYDTSPIGVDYDSSAGTWDIFNEDGSAMQVGETFNVLAVPKPTANAFVQTATASDSGGDSTFINSTATNDRPGAVLEVTPRVNGDVTFENHSVGVWYDTSTSKWAVFNEDQATMDESGNATFNVLVGSVGTGGGKNLIQKATSVNISDSLTKVNSSTTNGDPNAFVIETPSWNPGGKGGTYDTSPTGVATDGQDIFVANELGTPMARKAAFNLLMFNS
jgi:hypothetical protein